MGGNPAQAPTFGRDPPSVSRLWDGPPLRFQTFGKGPRSGSNLWEGAPLRFQFLRGGETPSGSNQWEGNPLRFQTLGGSPAQVPIFGREPRSTQGLDFGREHRSGSNLGGGSPAQFPDFGTPAHRVFSRGYISAVTFKHVSRGPASKAKRISVPRCLGSGIDLFTKCAIPTPPHSLRTAAATAARTVSVKRKE